MKQETTKNKVVTINGKRGEYTGFSNKTVKHHFSMYDGSTVALSELETIKLFGVDFVTPSHTYNQPQTKDESKEVKEGGELFTGGDWELIRETIGDDNTLQICGDKGVFVASVYEEPDAIVLTQSKNMYYALLNLVDKGVQATGQDYQNAIDILNKATPKK